MRSGRTIRLIQSARNNAQTPGGHYLDLSVDPCGILAAVMRSTHKPDMIHPPDDMARQHHHRTRIKLCGFTRQQDVESAVLLGADALGFVFYPKSKRYLDPEAAHRLVQNIPAFITTVALFVEPERTFVREVIDAMHPGLLQFHGAESPEYCDAFAWPYIKAFRVGAPGMETASALLASCRAYGNARGWLFDSYTPAYGGSGHGFDRSLLDEISKDRQSRAMILSGGLTVENVESLVTRVEPWAVDVSSGIELAPGEKCMHMMRDFIAAVRGADVKREHALLQN